MVLITKKPAMMKLKNVKTVMKSMKKKKNNVKTVKSKKEKDVTGTHTVNGRDYVIPYGWDVKKSLKINHLELSTLGLKSIWLPVTQVEQISCEAPEIYSETSTGSRTQAYIRYDNSEMDWMVSLDPLPLKVMNPAYCFKALYCVVCSPIRMPLKIRSQEGFFLKINYGAPSYPPTPQMKSG